MRGQTDQKSTDTSQQHVFQSEFVDVKKSRVLINLNENNC